MAAILTALMLSIICGSRLSYPLLSYNDQFFPEPAFVIILFVGLLVVPKSIIGKASRLFFKQSKYILIVAILFLIGINEGYPTRIAYSEFRSFLAIVIGYCFYRVILTQGLRAQIAFLTTYAISVFVCTPLSKVLYPTFSGLTTPDGVRIVIPFVVFFAAGFKAFKIRRIDILLLQMTLSILAFVITTYRTNLVSAIFLGVLLFYYVLLLHVRSISNSSRLIFPRIRLNRRRLTIAFCGSLVMASLLYASKSIVDSIEIDKYFFYYNRIASTIGSSLFSTYQTSQFVEATTRSSSIELITSNLTQLMLPHGFGHSRLIVSLSGQFLPLRDSGLLYLCYTFGILLLTTLVALTFVYRYWPVVHAKNLMDHLFIFAFIFVSAYSTSDIFTNPICTLPLGFLFAEISHTLHTSRTITVA